MNVVCTCREFKKDGRRDAHTRVAMWTGGAKPWHNWCGANVDSAVSNSKRESWE